MRDVQVPAEFLETGGTELAPMSTTTDLKTAMIYAKSRSSVLLRLVTRNFMSRAPDVSFLSCFPAEREYLYPPPLTYLSALRKWADGTPVTEVLPVDEAVYHVFDVEPVFS